MITPPVTRRKGRRTQSRTAHKHTKSQTLTLVWVFHEEVIQSLIISNDNSVDNIPKGAVSYCVL